MNIMEITSATGTSGAAVHCLMLTRELSRRGHKVTLVCRPGSWISRQVENGSINMVLSDLHRFPPGELRRIAGIARELGIHAIHTHMSRAHFFGVLLKLFYGVRCVATAHSCHFQPHWMFNDRVIAVSDYTRRYHRFFNLVPGKRIHLVHNFIDCGRSSKPSADMRRRVRESLGFSDSALLIGAIGNISVKKGITHLVRAMREVVAEVPDARLVVVGNGPLEYIAALKAEAAKLGIDQHILWTGHRSDVPDLMGALDLFASASLSENFPVSMTEAMAAGLPIVATDVGGVPECVIEGETGLLVRRGRSDALAKAIIELLKDPELRKRFGAAGRKRALEKFSPESQLPLIEGILWLAAGAGADCAPHGTG